MGKRCFTQTAVAWRSAAEITRLASSSSNDPQWVSFAINGIATKIKGPSLARAGVFENAELKNRPHEVYSHPYNRLCVI
jgi:transcription antitermination factor NusG